MQAKWPIRSASGVYLHRMKRLRVLLLPPGSPWMTPPQQYIRVPIYLLSGERHSDSDPRTFPQLGLGPGTA